MTRLLARLLTQNFPGKRDSFSSTSALADTPEEPVQSDAQTSQGLELWHAQLEKNGGARVLDLGPLRSATLAHGAAQGWDLGVVGYRAGSLLEHCKAFATNGTFDAALCWDLPNFCADEEEFAALGVWLGQALRPGAPIFVVLATRPPYSEAPGVYDVLDRKSLRTSHEAADERNVVFAQSRLGRNWPLFTADRSFLLRSGWQEHVLHRREGS